MVWHPDGVAKTLNPDLSARMCGDDAWRRDADGREALHGVVDGEPSSDLHPSHCTYGVKMTICLSAGRIQVFERGVWTTPLPSPRQTRWPKPF
eukprot:83259-Chlamydomonas_euryale.AAC.3